MRTVIVTGASRGIGEAAVRALLVAGVRVVGVARSAEPLRALSKEKIGGGGCFEWVVGDVTEAATIKAAIDLATSKGHELTGLVLNAAIVEPLERAQNINMDALRRCFEVNLFSLVAMYKEALPHLLKVGDAARVVLLTTALATLPLAGMIGYCCSKAAVDMLAAVLAKEQPGMTIVAMRPGIVETSMLQTVTADEHDQRPTPLDAENIRYLREFDKLEPHQPGSAAVRLVLGAPHELSGLAIEWDDPRVPQLTG